MTDATLPALSSPTPDAAPPLSAMDCATEEEPSQSTSNMTDSSQSSGSVSGGPFCDLTGAQLLKHCNSGMLESPECLKLKEIPYSNDIHASASGIENVAFNLSNQKLVEEIPSLKSSPASQVTLCSNEAFCAKKHTGEMVEAQLNMRSSVEANHLQLPVLPKLDASSKSSAVNVDLLEKQILLTEQLPVSVETKEDPLSMDSSASTKSINSLSCDEASSKDSLLTSTESKSVGSPPEADLTSSTEVKEFYEASKTEAIEPKCNKTKVSSLSGVDCVKPFVVAADETDSGCPSDSDGMALHNSYDEVSTEKTATLKKVGIGAPSGSLISVTLSDVNLSSAFNPSTSSNSLNLGASASTSDGSHTCDTSEKTVEGSISSSSVVMADVHQNRTEGIHMQDGALTQKENKIFSGLECMKAASALGTSGDESLSTGSHVESSEDKSLQSKMGQKKSECQSQSSSLCDAAGTAMQVAEFTTSSTHCDPATINKFSTIDDEIHPKYQMKPLPQPHVNLQGSKSESVKFTVTGCVQTTHGGSIPKEKVSISESDCAVGAIKEGTSLGNIKSDEMMEVAQSQNVTADEDDLKVKDSETGSIECSLASPEKCVPISTAECATESLQGICDEMSIGCKKSESSSSMKVGQLLNCAREMGSKNEETADSCGQLQVDVSSQNLEADECTEVSESCGALGESQKPHLTRLLCSDNSSSTNKSVDTAMLATECSLNIGGKLGCALLSSTSSSTEPDTNTSESKHAPESLAVTETSVKFHLSTEVESAGVLESRGDVQISITQNDAPESAFKNEVSPAYEANFSNEVESSVSKSCGSVCPTPSTTLSTNELATTEVDVAAAPDITECSSTAETSKIAHETTGQVLKIEHAESLKEESSSADATDVNLDQELKASEHSDLPSRGPVNAASGDMVIDKKIEMGCVVSEDVICSKQTTESGKTFPSVDVSCDSGDVVLQTVVGGVLQTLDVAALEARKKEEEDSDHRKLFAGVDDELTGASDALSRNTAMHVLENNAGEMDGIGGLVINSVVGAFGEGVDEYADGESAAEADSSNKDLADISSSYHAMNKDIDSQQPECDDRPRSKRPRLEGAESEVRRPVFLRVKPVKGKSESFWDSPKLRTALAEKGTVLLRLCTVEPTEDFDSPADFVGVMLECCEDAGYGGHMTDRHNSPDMYSVGVDGGYHPGVYNHYGYVSRTPAGGDEDFVETEEVEESMDYDGTGHTLDWQGKPRSFSINKLGATASLMSCLGCSSREHLHLMR
ncbi:hypothetical protein FHG87_017101 [Trinorchestia longiramus]|nr:hypothetical protein FHG87_017101 [Trinorchestia longiramus]